MTRNGHTWGILGNNQVKNARSCFRTLASWDVSENLHFRSMNVPYLVVYETSKLVDQEGKILVDEGPVSL